MKKKIFWLLKFIVLPLVVVFLGLVSFILLGFRQNLGDCPVGNLSRVESCEKDGSWFSWMGSGWYYFLSRGPISKEFCSNFIKDGIWQQSGHFVFGKKRSKNEYKIIQQVTCKDYFKEADGICYSFDKLASNGNSHYYYFFQMDKQCNTGTFFQGSKRTLKEGSVEKTSLNRMTGG